MQWLLLPAAAGVALVPVAVYFLLWFTQPIRSSLHDPPALSYTPEYIDPTTKRSTRFPSLLTTPTATLTLSLIIPAYNEQSRIRTMMDATLAYLHKRRKADSEFTFECIVVDDGSKDGTYDVAMEYVMREGSDVVRVMRLKQNQGKGGAVQQGMLHARGQWLLMVDADGATEIEDVELLEQAVHKRIASTSSKGTDGSCAAIVAVGSRAHLADTAISKRAWYRNILMYGFHFLVSSLCVRDIRDTQCGFKLFSRDAARRLFTVQHLRRWCFDVELLYLSQRMGIGLVEVSVHWQEIPGSKIQLLESSLLMGRDLIVIRLCYMLGIWTTAVDEQAAPKAAGGGGGGGSKGAGGKRKE